MKVRTVLLATVFAAACGGGEVIPSTVVKSVNWGPVQPTYDGIVRARAEGRLENRGGSHAVTTGTYQDRAADGNTAYHCTQFLFWRVPSTGTSPVWHPGGRACTPEISTSAGVRQIENVHVSLAANSSTVRGRHSACAQFGWPVPDPCADAIAAFGY